MSFDIGAAFVGGLKNLWNKATLTIVLALTFVYLLQDFGIDTLTAWDGQAANAPLAIGSSAATASVLLLASTVLTVLLALTALRFYSSGSSELEESMYKENLLMPAINFVVGVVAFSILVGFGFLLLIVPGLFLLTALYFYSFRIAVEDENFIQAFKSSYSLTEGNRLELFGLGVIVTVPALIVSLISIPLLLIAQLAGTGVALVSMLLYNLVLAVIFVSILSIAGQAYNQLLELQE